MIVGWVRIMEEKKLWRRDLRSHFTNVRLRVPDITMKGFCNYGGLRNWARPGAI